jgi:hypothetical protein
MTSNARLTSAQIVIIVLALATAAIHFSRAAADVEISTLFILNGAGYLALVAGMYLPVAALQRFRPQVRWVLIGYTALTVVLYLVWGGMSGEWVAPLGPIDKVIEIAMLALLWREKQAGAT